MKTSESIKAIAPAWVKAQAEIKAAVKDAVNPHFKSKYADLASVIEAVRLPLNKAGLSFLQPVSTSQEGVCVETVILHTSGEWLSESLVIPVVKNDAQGVGSAITYGKRYGLQSMCGVPSDDDDGNAATVAAPKAAHTPSMGAWESLTTDEQTQVADIVECVRREFADKGADAAAILWADETTDIGAEAKIAGWAKLPSNERSAMKKAREKAAMQESLKRSPPVPIPLSSQA